MLVKDLVRLLRKMDQNAKVATRDHDNSEDEISGWPKGVTQQDASDLGEMGERLTGPIVVIQC